MANPGKSWIQTLQSRALFQRALRPEMVGSIEEIAHALSGNFRFTRQTQQFYSVAEHCCRGAALLSKAFAPAFLLHELSETYLADMAGPMKPDVLVRIEPDDVELFQPHGIIYEVPALGYLVFWSTLERQHTRTMLQALGLGSLEPMIYAPEVKAMDLAMLAAEKRDLCAAPPEDWPGLEGVIPANVNVAAPWHPPGAKAEFLGRFRQLFQ